MTKQNQNEAKFVTVVEVNGHYELEFLTKDMECVEFKEYDTEQRANEALAYWSGPNKTLTRLTYAPAVRVSAL